MRTRIVSLNVAVTLGVIAFLTLLTRITFLDAMYVPEFRILLPENQPLTIAVVMGVYMVFAGAWVWSLLAAAHGSHAGLIASLIFCLFGALGGGLFTLLALCPNGCAAWPVGNGIVWANLLSGLAGSVALGLQLNRQLRGEAA